MVKNVLGIFAHPDDAEFMCAGTLSLLHKAGWSIHIAALAKGDKGTALLSREEISSIRYSEGTKSASLLNGSFHCLGLDDVYIMYDRDTINKTTALIRKVKPLIVFTGSPNDYMIDHEITSKVVQTACFSCGIKNMEVDEEPFGQIPHLFFCDSMEGLDKFGDLLHASIYVNIDSEIQTKINMLSCHASQRGWLLDHHKMDEFTAFVKDLAILRGIQAGVNYAEGFRQCLGHSFPAGNILRELLGDHVIIKESTKILSANYINSK